MTSINVLENQISEVEKYLKILSRYKKYTQLEIEKNIDLRGAVERYLYLACQSAIDLAESYIAYRKFRKPQSMNDTFYILEEEKIIDIDMREIMIDMKGFRNFIAHDYGKIDYDVVFDVLKNKLPDLKKFSNIIEEKI